MSYRKLMVLLSLMFILFLNIPQSSVSVEYSNQVLNDTSVNNHNISSDSRWQMKSSIWGDNIVWEDYRNDPIGSWSSPGNRNSDIYLYNNTTNEIIQLTTHNSSQVNPDIWKNFVVWEDYRNGNADIYYIDISNITNVDYISVNRLTDNAEDQIKPKIHDGKVVWEDYRENSYGDIFLFDLHTQQGPFRINTRGDDAQVSKPHNDPDIFDNYVVWTDYRNHWYTNLAGDIFGYNISMDSDGDGVPNYKDQDRTEQDPAEFEVTNKSKHQHSPSIYENKIVWTEYNKSSDNDIYMVELDGEKVRITDSHMKEDNPNIYGGIVVYSRRKYDDGNTPVSDSVWYYNIYSKENNIISEISVDPNRPSSVKIRYPHIFQNKIVWEEQHESNAEELDYQYDVFYTNISNEPPEIISFQVKNDSYAYGDSTKLLLKEGNFLKFKAEIRDVNGDIEDVKLNISELNLDEDYLSMDNVKPDIYRTKLEYSPDLSEGEYNILLKVEDSTGNIIRSKEVKIILSETSPSFNFVGIGTKMDNLSHEINFILGEDDHILFVANITDYEEDISRVYVDVSSFNLTKKEYNLTLQNGSYVYDFIYQDGLTSGNKEINIIAVDERGHLAKSRSLFINIFERVPEEPEIISVGVGKTLDDLSSSSDFILEEGRSIYFVINISYEEGSLSNVYIDLSEFNESMDEVQMSYQEESNTYSYKLDYDESFELGEKHVYIYVEDSFDNRIQSSKLIINCLEPDTDDGQADAEDSGVNIFYYLIPIFLALILVFIIIFFKKPEFFKDIFKKKK